MKKLNPKGYFTIADNGWIKDKRLSAKAKGIFLYLVMLPDDWDLHIAELVTHFTNGEKSIRAGMKELVDLGYVEIVLTRDEQGMMTGNDYKIFEYPSVQNPHAENRHAEDEALLSTKEKLSTNNTLRPSEVMKEIIAYLNKKTGKNFKDNNQKTLKLLNARLRDYTADDIMAVIDIKCQKWLNTEWAIYLRPSTLFNVNKFESYVNEITVRGSESRCGGAMPLQDLQ